MGLLAVIGFLFLLMIKVIIGIVIVSFKVLAYALVIVFKILMRLGYAFVTVVFSLLCAAAIAIGTGTLLLGEAAFAGGVNLYPRLIHR